jgi:hypothetical protein
MDTTTFNDALKEYYTGDTVEELQIRDRPLLSYLTRFEKFQGRRLPIVIQFGDPQNVSSQFTDSQGRENEGTTQVAEFDLLRTNLYNTVAISTDVMEASEGMGAGAWLDARTTEINNGLDAISNRLAQLAYRSGWGEVGNVGVILGNTITLNPVSDAYMFEKDMYVTFAPTLATSVLRGTGLVQYLKVSSVNRSSGLITFTTAVATVTGGGGVVTVGDFIFTRGDRQDSATPVQRVVAGLEGWAPAGGATAALWFGKDRTVDSRLSGVSYNGTADPPEDAIIECANRMAENGQTATHAFTSYRQFSKVVKSQRQLTRFRDTMTATVGFDGVIIMGSKGPIKLVPDQYCPNNRAFLIDQKAVKLYSSKKAVRVIDNDGNMVLRQSSADGVEVRLGFKGNIGSRAPSGIGNVQLTPV